MGLWRHREFLKFWAGQAISLLGTQVTQLALGLTAAVVLQASALEMGVLGTLYSVPYLLFGLAAGVWVDRVHGTPLLIVADLGRAALLATVPLAALTQQLSMPLLYVVSFGVGTLNVIFNLALRLVPAVCGVPRRAAGGQHQAGIFASIALGSLVGGVLAEAIGLRPTLLLGGLLPLFGLLWLPASPIRGLRRLDSYAVACSDDS